MNRKFHINFSSVKERAMVMLQGNWMMFALSLVFSTIVFMLLIPMSYIYSVIQPGIVLTVTDYFRIFVATSASDSLMFTLTAAMYCVIFRKTKEEKKGIGLLFKKANLVFPASIVPIFLTKIIFAFFSFLINPVVSDFLYDHIFLTVLSYTTYCIIIAVLGVVLSVASIYVSLTYILTPCVIADNPDISGIQAMRTSRLLMKRKKGNMALFIVSFAVWYMIGILCFGLGMFWAHAYMLTAVYIYFHECIEHLKGELKV